MESQTLNPQTPPPAQPNPNQPRTPQRSLNKSTFIFITILILLFIISSGLAIFYYFQAMNNATIPEPLPVPADQIDTSPTPTAQTSTQPLTFGLRNLENKNLGQLNPDIQITAQIPTTATHQLTNEIEDIYKITDTDFSLYIHYPYEVAARTRNDLIPAKQVYFSPNNIPAYRINVSDPGDPAVYRYSSTYQTTQTGIDETCKLWSNTPDQIQTCYSGYIESPSTDQPWVLIISCEANTPNGVDQCDQIVNSIQVNKLTSALTPTIAASTTYTDQQYGYSITYNPDLWQFRRTYGEGINTQGQTDIISGIDLHNPTQIGATATIVLNVLEAYGITDPQTWLDQYETQDRQLSNKSTGTNYIEFDTPISASPPIPYSKIRYLIAKDKMYRIFFSHRGGTNTNAELYDVLNTFTP